MNPFLVRLPIHLERQCTDAVLLDKKELFDDVFVRKIQKFFRAKVHFDSHQDENHKLQTGDVIGRKAVLADTPDFGWIQLSIASRDVSQRDLFVYPLVPIGEIGVFDGIALAQKTGLAGMEAAAFPFVVTCLLETLLTDLLVLFAAFRGPVKVR